MFKPMLATTVEDFNSLTYPLMASAKLDGYRAVCYDNKALSRSLKPIRNNYVRSQLEANMDTLNSFDGELCLANLTENFSTVSSAISASDGYPDFRYVVFDYVGDGSYQERFLSRVKDALPAFVIVVPMQIANNFDELMAAHSKWTGEGFEGTMVRRFDGKDVYKAGRSTPSQQYLLKIKDFDDDEATIINFEERMSNQNEATTNELGRTQRSSHQENLVGRGDLGALVVKCDKYPEPFRIGTGFDDATRKLIYDNRDEWLGKLIKFKHQTSGELNAPRFPVYLGLRSLDDIS